jgi:hypothetical protein
VARDELDAVVVAGKHDGTARPLALQPLQPRRLHGSVDVDVGEVVAGARVADGARRLADGMDDDARGVQAARY